MIPLIALVALHYDGRRVSKGKRFSARSPQDARLLKAIGRAKDAPAPVVKPADTESVAVEPTRTYRRRDLTAEA